MNVPGIRWRGDEGQARPLPTHGGPDQKPSFTVNAAKGAWYCHTENLGGGVKELAQRLGVEPPFLNKQDRPRRREEVAAYSYCDAAGNLLYQAVRYEPKDFRQRQPDPENPGGWLWNMRGVEPLPYRLPEFLAALERGETVLIVEGEKDVESLAALGLAVTCNHGGTGKWTEAHSKHFPEGAEVVILPDCDDPGRDHARKVAHQLTDRGCRVRVVELPGLPQKGDVSDWLAAGGTKEELLAMVEQSAYFEPDQNGRESNLPGVYDEWKELLTKTGRYCVDRCGYLCCRKFYPDGDVEEIPIANFLARPVREISRDDGRETVKTFEITGLLARGIPLPPAAVLAKDFASMTWVTAACGRGGSLPTV